MLVTRYGRIEPTIESTEIAAPAGIINADGKPSLYRLQPYQSTPSSDAMPLRRVLDGLLMQLGSG
ncbi:hypothetical protein DPV78_002259 [Talaromyces pinophilus]|nr:hypothetical protein DPV78_002259 [Talaromyces pinophilus]